MGTRYWKAGRGIKVEEHQPDHSDDHIDSFIHPCTPHVFIKPFIWTRNHKYGTEGENKTLSPWSVDSGEDWQRGHTHTGKCSLSGKMNAFLLVLLHIIPMTDMFTPDTD